MEKEMNFKTQECPVCKAALSVAALACPHCGHPLIEKKEHVEVKKTGISFIGVVLAVFLALILFAFC